MFVNIILKCSLFDNVGRFWYWLEYSPSSFWIDIYEVIVFCMTCQGSVVAFSKLVSLLLYSSNTIRVEDIFLSIG